MAKYVIEAELPFGNLTVTKDGVLEPHVSGVEFYIDTQGTPGVLSIDYFDTDVKQEAEVMQFLSGDTELVKPLDDSLQVKLGGRTNLKKVRIESEGTVASTKFYINDELQKCVQSIHLMATLNDKTKLKVKRYLFS